MTASTSGSVTTRPPPGRAASARRVDVRRAAPPRGTPRGSRRTRSSNSDSDPITSPTGHLSANTSSNDARRDDGSQLFAANPVGRIDRSTRSRSGLGRRRHPKKGTPLRARPGGFRPCLQDLNKAVGSIFFVSFTVPSLFTVPMSSVLEQMFFNNGIAVPSHCT